MMGNIEAERIEKDKKNVNFDSVAVVCPRIETGIWNEI